MVLKAKRFSHEDAHAISKWVLGRDRSRSVVVVDLSQADDATTAAFATLVVLRRRLLKHGRDLRVVGLRDRAQWVYTISRLEQVLPRHIEDLADNDPPLATAA
ncbi:hypothetical protein [Humisphaera borealis]|uniref:STAS domain-containing protein n=1 Tax=Humisphaera borealis TaxID=2807512 RepID=A0A7M2WWJ4_9BACT|nr:hypothetical protein [Humisphaera borealis]QOV89694.1 hypothetical protein IPV69_26485 [Humisphaera borealis]